MVILSAIVKPVSWAVKIASADLHYNFPTKHRGANGLTYGVLGAGPV